MTTLLADVRKLYHTAHNKPVILCVLPTLVRSTTFLFIRTFNILLFVNNGFLLNSVPLPHCDIYIYTQVRPSCEFLTYHVALLWFEVGQPSRRRSWF